MPTIVARVLFRRSLLLIGAIGQSEDPDAVMYNDAKDTFNDMLDNWSTETLSVFSADQFVFPLTAGKDTYTWGAGGDFGQSRPIYVIDANFTLGGNTAPVRILPNDLFNVSSASGVTAQYVQFVTYVNTAPLGILKVAPVPSADSMGLKLTARRKLTRVDNLDQVIDLPEGYTKALRYSLAVDLWPEYPNPTVDINTIKQIATASKADIQRANSVDIEMSFSDIPDSGQSTGDWRLG
jgi:hypothetical protein